jgi:hypothetical protein
MIRSYVFFKLLQVVNDFFSSRSVAANHEALSRLRLGFKSRREHADYYPGSLKKKMSTSDALRFLLISMTFNVLRILSLGIGISYLFNS